jgi:hypothetical protein
MRESPPRMKHDRPVIGNVAEPVPPSPAEERLRELIENVTEARYVLRARDSSGTGMDTAKIIEDPSGGYLAVYHSFRRGVFSVLLASSDDLISWSRRAELGRDASQPYIAALPDRSYLVAWEAHGRGYNWLSLRRYPDRTGLLAASPARVFDAPHTQVPDRRWAEGTPNLYAAWLDQDGERSIIDVGFHYFRDGRIDRQARGTLIDFRRWSTRREPDLDAAVLAHGVRGNIGDRDTVVLAGERFTVVEGQQVKGDFGSWRTFLYPRRTGQATLLAPRTPGGSRAFANPAVTALTGPDGRPSLVVSMFIPSEAAAPGEAGQLIYFRPVDPD